MALELTPDEARIVLEALERALAELRAEIADNDSQDYRDRLVTRKAVLSRVVEGLRGHARAA